MVKIMGSHNKALEYSKGIVEEGKYIGEFIGKWTDGINQKIHIDYSKVISIQDILFYIGSDDRGHLVLIEV